MISVTPEAIDLAVSDALAERTEEALAHLRHLGRLLELANDALNESELLEHVNTCEILDHAVALHSRCRESRALQEARDAARAAAKRKGPED